MNQQGLPIYQISLIMIATLLALDFLKTLSTLLLINVAYKSRSCHCNADTEQRFPRCVNQIHNQQSNRTYNSKQSPFPSVLFAPVDNKKVTTF